MSKQITLPLSAEERSDLRSGETLLLSGEILVGRDQVHKRLVELIEANQELPLSLEGETIYYMGPAPAPKNCVIGSCGPTTSARMDRFWPILMAHGLLISIGKGPRSAEVQEAIVTYGGLYLAAYGGCGALYATKVKAVETVTFADLGPEALLRLTIEDFPVVVAIDSLGNSVYG